MKLNELTITSTNKDKISFINLYQKMVLENNNIDVVSAMHNITEDMLFKHSFFAYTCSNDKIMIGFICGYFINYITIYITGIYLIPTERGKNKSKIILKSLIALKNTEKFKNVTTWKGKALTKKSYNICKKLGGIVESFNFSGNIDNISEDKNG